MRDPAPPVARSNAVRSKIICALAAARIELKHGELQEALAGMTPLYVDDIETFGALLGKPAADLLVGQ